MPPPTHDSRRSSPADPAPRSPPQRTGPGVAPAATHPPRAASESQCLGRSRGSCSCGRCPGGEAGEPVSQSYRKLPRRVKSDRLLGTRFPSLPCRAGERGLVYPLSGTSWCTGPELVVALAQGAKITVEAGWRIEWTKADVYPFAEFTK